jgi:hypothetical protein
VVGGLKLLPPGRSSPAGFALALPKRLDALARAASAPRRQGRAPINRPTSLVRNPALATPSDSVPAPLAPITSPVFAKMSAAGAAATAPPLPATSGPQPNSRSIEVDVGSGELVEFELSQLANAEAEVLEVLSVLSEAPAQTWAVCILELVRLGRLELAEMMVTEGLKGPLSPRTHPSSGLPLLTPHVCSLVHQSRCRRATTRVRFRFCSSLPT